MVPGFRYATPRAMECRPFGAIPHTTHSISYVKQSAKSSFHHPSIFNPRSIQICALRVIRMPITLAFPYHTLGLPYSIHNSQVSIHHDSIYHSCFATHLRTNLVASAAQHPFFHPAWDPCPTQRKAHSQAKHRTGRRFILRFTDHHDAIAFFLIHPGKGTEQALFGAIRGQFGCSCFWFIG